MASSLCCDAIMGYRPMRTDHETKFTSFLAWAKDNNVKETNVRSDAELAEVEMSESAFIIQLVTQVNYGRILSKRYFLTTSGDGGAVFYEVAESFLLAHNFEKLNTYKNYKCPTHDLFFEFNVYRRNPINKHHWRINAARPGTEIDLGV